MRRITQWWTHRWTSNALAALFLLAGGCAHAPLATLPFYPESRLHNDTLFVLLPGIWDNAKDFETQGFIKRVKESHLPADLVAVDASVGYYLNQSVTRRLKQDVIDPAKRRGYKRIWLIGISLGGLGSLLYTREYPEDVAGVIVFSPYLGRDTVSDEIAEAGGLRAWTPPEPTDDWERPFWKWLKESSGDPAQPPIYIGYGNRDQFARANALLANALPDGHELVVEGAHDWRTWQTLWSRMLAIQSETIFPAPVARSPKNTAWELRLEGARHP